MPATTRPDRMAKSLSGSRSLVADLLASIPNGVVYGKVVTSADGRPKDFVFIDVNAAYERFAGVSKDRLLGRRSTSVFSILKNDRSWLEPYARAALEGQSSVFESHWPLTGRWYRTIVYSPQRPLFVAIYEDVDDRRRAEQALYESEDKYRRLVNDAPEAIFVIRGERLLYANDVAISLFGAANFEELASHSIQEVIPRDDLGIFKKRAVEALEGRRLPLREARIVRLGGGMIPVEVASSAIDYEGAKAIQVVVRDISERKRSEQARIDMELSLRTERKLLQTLIDGPSNMHLVYLDRDFNFVRVNKAYARTCGYAPDEMIGKNHFTLYPSEENERIFRQVRDTGSPAQFHDKPFTFPDQPERGVTYWDWTLEPVRDDSGQVEGLVFSLVETTDRKRSELALAESERRFRLLADGTPSLLWMSDETGENRFVNKYYLEYFGIAFEEAEGFRWRPLVHPDDVKAYASRYLDAVHEHKPFNMIIRVKRRNEWRWLESTASPRFSPTGEYLGHVGISVDVTERKTAVDRLAQEYRDTKLLSDLSLRLIGEADMRAFYQEIMNAAVAVTEANKGTLQIFEGGSLHIVASHGHGQPFLDFFANAELVVSACGAASLRNERVIVEDVQNSPLFTGTPSLQMLQDSGVRAVQSTPIVSRDGSLLGVLTTQWTVPHTPSDHDLWRLDTLARQAADFIEHRAAVESLRQYSKSLERSNADLEQFAYVASHDLQEPLRMIATHLGMLERKYSDQLDATSKEHIEFSIDGAKRMKALIDDLLVYSRVTSQARPFTTVDMNAVVEKALTNIAKAREEAEAEIEVGQLPTILADESQMVQLMQNLLSNAVKFRGERRPIIRVGSSAMSDRFVFSVKDNGIGLGMAYSDKIFKMFHRLQSTADYPGTGVGLAIAKKIVERHGGRIWVESEEGEGATFYFSIPRTPETSDKAWF